MNKSILTILVAVALLAIAPQSKADAALNKFELCNEQQLAADKAQQVTYVAVQNYIAGNENEVSFNEGDIIVNVSQMDDGWVKGKVQRTSQTGIFPSSYVEIKN